MRAHQPDLIGSRRRVRAGRLRHFKAGDRNVIDERAARVETGLAHVDFGKFRIRVGFMEIGPNGCGLIIDRTAPHVHGGIRINQRHDGIGGGVTAGIPTLWVAHLVQRGDFVEGFAIQIHIAQVAYLDLWVRVYGPIAEYGFHVRVVSVEECVRDYGFPHAIAFGLPCVDTFGAGDYRARFARGRAVDDAVRGALSAESGSTDSR